MAATVEVQEANGATPVWTTISSARYCVADIYNPGLSYPIPIPSSGFHYSYWKHHALYITGTFTQVSNIRWYTDGTINWTLGTNGGVRVGKRDSGDNGCPVANYAQASGIQGTTGYAIEDPINGHPYYKNQNTPVVNVESFTSANPLIVDSSSYTSPSRTKGVVTQVKVASDAIQGDQPDETFTFVYDEI